MFTGNTRMRDPDGERKPTWIEVPGGALPVWSEGQGAPILLIHGWTLDARIWTPQTEAWRSSHQVIRYDRRGFGQATAPADPQAEIDDIRHVLDALELDQATIVGMSQGARSALAFAALNPSRVSALVLAGAPFPFAPPDDVPAEIVPIPEMRRLANQGDWDGLRRLWHASPLIHMPGATDEATALLLRVSGDYRAADLLTGLPPIELSEVGLAQMVVPTLLIVGQHDGPLRHAAAERLAALLPSASRAEIVGAGHLCTLSHAEDFNRRVIHFLNATKQQS